VRKQRQPVGRTSGEGSRQELFDYDLIGRALVVREICDGKSARLAEHPSNPVRAVENRAGW
jgi:hypothetical protein